MASTFTPGLCNGGSLFCFKLSLRFIFSPLHPSYQTHHDGLCCTRQRQRKEPMFCQLLPPGVVYHSFVFDGLLCFSVPWYTFLIFAVVYDRRSWSSAAIH